MPCGCCWCPAHIASTPPSSTRPLPAPPAVLVPAGVSEAPAHRENRACPKGFISPWPWPWPWLWLWPSTEPAAPSVGRTQVVQAEAPLHREPLSCLASDFLSPAPPTSFHVSSGVISLTESLELKSSIQGLFPGEPSFYVAHSSFTRNPRAVKMWPHLPQWSLQWAPCLLHASGWPSRVTTMGLGPHFQLRVSLTPLSSLGCSSAPRLLLVTCLVSGGPVVYEAPSGLSADPLAGSGSSSVS